MYEIPDKMPDFISLVQGVFEADISFLCMYFYAKEAKCGLFSSWGVHQQAGCYYHYYY